MIESFKSGIWTDENGIVGAVLGVEPIDPERDDVAQTFDSLRRVLKKIDSKIVVRVWVESRKAEQEIFGSRKAAIKALGVIHYRHVVIIETGHDLSLKKLFVGVPNLDESRDRISQAVEFVKSSGLKVTPMDREQSLAFFPRSPAHWQAQGSIVDSGYTNSSVVRVDLGRAEEISGMTLHELQRDLPKPFALRVSFQRVSDHEAEITLTRRLQQSSSAKSRLDDARTNALENTMLKTSLEGNSLFRIEFLAVMVDHSAPLLKRNTEECARVLSRLGQTRIETYGAVPSLLASFAGVPQHVTFLETLRIYHSFFQSLEHEARGPRRRIRPSAFTVMVKHLATWICSIPKL